MSILNPDWNDQVESLIEELSSNGSYHDKDAKRIIKSFLQEAFRDGEMVGFVKRLDNDSEVL